MTDSLWHRVVRIFGGSLVEPETPEDQQESPLPLPKTPTTAEEWLLADSPVALLRAARLAGSASDRKGRLTAVGFVRLFRDAVLPDTAAALALAERLADGKATEKDRLAGLRTVGVHPDHCKQSLPHCVLNWSGFQAPFRVLAALAMDSCGAFPAVGPAHRAATCDLVRDIFGNPFRPVVFAPTWRTSTAVALAEGIHADRAFDRLPILADALEDAGCDNGDLLIHCRGDGPHVRGCWAVDLVLGRT